MADLMDNVVVRFTVENNQLLGGMKEAERAIGNVGKAGAQVNKTAGALGAATKQSRGFTNQMIAQNNSLHTAGSLLKDMQSQTGNLSSSFRRSALSIQTNVAWLDKFSILADRASMAQWKFSMAALSFQQLAATTGTVMIGLGMATKQMVDSFSLIDRLKRQFTTIYKSAEIGGQMVDQLVNDAVKIRYSINEVLEAGRLLALEGFNPKDLIYDMADLGAGVNQEGITIVNATRAFVDATNGQFRRLKETFQITREDAMAFAPDAFQGPNNQISNQAKATEAIVRAIRSKYRGQNDATMQTISGMRSNLDDALVKSTAKLGTAIEGTVVGWIKSLMGLLEQVGDFAETDLGKATAQTFLWGTAIMGAVTGLALLTSGMVTLLGVFAAYRVFMEGRKGGMAQIIAAELELAKVTQELAAIEAGRGMENIAMLRTRLALAKAIAEQDKARINLLLTETAGVGGKQLSDAKAAMASTTIVRNKAQNALDKEMLPREILKMEDQILVSQAKQTLMEGEELAIQKQKTAELERQLATMRNQLTAARLGLEVPMSAADNERAVALQSQINALKRQELLYEGKLADTANHQKYADEVHLARLREQLALREAELAAVRATAATTVGSMGAGRRFGAGFGRGAGAALGIFDDIFGMLLSPIKSLAAVITGAVKAAGGFAATLGIVSGFIAVMGAAIGVGYLFYNTLKKDADAARTFQTSMKEAADAADKWSKNIRDMSPTESRNVDWQKRFGTSTSKTGEEGKLRYGTTAAANFGAAILRVLDQVVLGTSSQASEEDIPMREHTVEFGKQLLESTQGDLDATKDVIMALVRTAKAQGKPLQFQGEELTAERVAAMSEEDIRKLEMPTKTYRDLVKDTKADIEKSNAAIAAQNEAINQRAREYAKTKLAQEGLSDSERDFYTRISQSTNAAEELNMSLEDTYKSAKDAIPEVKSVSDAIEDGVENGKDEATVFAEIAANAQTGNAELKKMEDANRDLLRIGGVQDTQREKDLKDKREQVRLLNQQKALFWDIVNLQKGQEMAGVGSAAGLPGMGAAFGGRNVAGNMAQYKTTKDTKYLTQAYADYIKQLDEEQQASLDLYAPGANASASDKAEYAKYQARLERETRAKKRATEEAALRDMQAMGKMSLEEVAAARRGIAVNDRKSANRAGEFDKQAYDIGVTEKVGRLEALRRGAAAGGASERDLARYDLQILQTKLAQAKANNDITAQMQLQAEAAEKIKQLSDAALNDEQAKLSFMQTQADQGLISEEAVEAEKRRLAKMYQEMARQAAFGSAEYYANMQRALELLGDSTEDKWTGIIGQILGAPQQLLSNAVSDSWLSQFGDAANVLGMGSSIKADIVSQRGSEILLRIRSDIPLESLDSKVRNAVEGIAPNIASQLSYALNYA